jgi:hypothetical protein
MRANAMSSGVSVPPRDGSAEARAITMKEVQIRTVTMAAPRPTVFGETRMGAIIPERLRLCRHRVLIGPRRG